MQNILSIIDPSAIWNLPSPYNWIAFIIIGFMLLRIPFLILRFKLIKAATVFFGVVVFSILLSVNAPLIEAFSGSQKSNVEQTPKTD